MSLIKATPYFDTRMEAYEHYAKKNVDKKTVKELLRVGLIFIGIPPHENEFNLSINEGRYFIKET